MDAEDAKQPYDSNPPPGTLEISHVLFMDIVSYSILPMDHQSKVISELQEIVRGVADFRQALARQELICLPTGDGMALAFFGDPSLPLLCARQIAVSMKKNPRFSLRMGVHTGPVYRVADINANRNLAGGGINLAQRVMDCGDAGHILMSNAAAEILRQLSTWNVAIHEIGEFEVKHGVRINLFNVFSDDYGNPSAPSRMSSTAGPKLDKALPSRDGRSNLGPRNEVCPFRGLQAFRTQDSEFFAGRELACTRLWDALRTKTFIAIIGSSGSGKSSLVHAGLLARIEHSKEMDVQWAYASLIPGSRPFQRLAAAILSMTNPNLTGIALVSEGQALVDRLRPGSDSLESILALLSGTLGNRNILLVIDQFEELFTMAEDADRKLFIHTIVRACSDRLKIVITLRADYYGHAIAINRVLSDLLEVAAINLGPMTRDEVTEAITLPARAAGAEFEPGLVSRILKDVEEQPGYLPLLEFALTELWERRRGALLTHGAYEDIGGIGGAIANRGESLFQALSDEEQTLVRKLFSRLVRVARTGEERNDTRNRVRRSELSNIPWSLIERFAAQDFRLLVIAKDPVSPEETVEVSHEALISNWSRLAGWIDEDRRFLLWRQELAVFLAAWESSGGDAASLLRAKRLREALEWRKKRKDDLNTAEIEFIRNSRSAARVSKVFKRTMWAGAILLASLVVAILIFSQTDLSVAVSIANDMTFARFLRERGGNVFPADRYCVALVFSGQNPAGGCPVNAIAGALTAIGQEGAARQYILKLSDHYFRCDALLSIEDAFIKGGDTISAKRLLMDALSEARQIENPSSKTWGLSRVADAFAALKMPDIAARILVEARSETLRIEPASQRPAALVDVTLGSLRLNPGEAVKTIANEETDDATRCNRFLTLADTIAPTNQAAAAEFLAQVIGRTSSLASKVREPLLAKTIYVAVDKLPINEAADITESVLSIAKTLPYSDERDNLLGAVLFSYLMTANASKAEQVQDIMTVDHLKKIQYSLPAIGRLTDLHRSQPVERILGTLEGGVHTMLKRPLLTERSAGIGCMALNVFAALHARNGNKEIANRLLTEGAKCADTVTNENWRSAIFQHRAIANAFLGQYRPAVAAAEFCSNSEHKISAHAIILAELGKRKYPSIANRIEMVEANWPGLYWLPF